MLILSLSWALTAPALEHPTAPMPHEVCRWSMRHTFKHKSPVTAVTATTDGYVTGDTDGVLLLWDATTGKLRETLLDGTNASAKPINAVRLTPDGKRLNVLTNDLASQIEMTGKDRTFRGPYFIWSVLTLCDDGNWLGSSRLQDLGSPRVICALALRFESNGFYAGWQHQFKHPVDVRFAASAPGFIASADADHTVRGWKFKKDQQSEQATWSIDLKKLAPSALAVSPDGTLVAVAGATGTVEVLDAKKGRAVSTLKGHAGAVRSVAFAPDSGLIATGGEDGTVRLWNPWSGEQEAVLKGHTEPLAAVWFASDDVLLSTSADKTARVWAYVP